MTEPAGTGSGSHVAAQPSTAGGLLRQARQAQGLHIAALAAAIKVVPRKLELLESDQFEQLPDPTFTRALAQAVCRTLKIDPAPVLALLPPVGGHRLERVAQGLNTPFHERPGRLVQKDWAGVASPALWLAALLVIAAAAVYVLPSDWLPWPRAENAGPAPTLVTDLPGEPPSAVAVVPPGGEPAASSPIMPPALVPPNASAIAPAMASDAPLVVPPAPLRLSAKAASWVEVSDASGQALFSRVLRAGESVELDGAMPFRLKIGNASVTEVVFRGQPLALAEFTRDNVARFELKSSRSLP